MIPYKLQEERDCLKNSEEAIKFAEFFWRAVIESNNQDKINGTNSEQIFEKIIITLMAYYRSSGYEVEWKAVADKN